MTVLVRILAIGAVWVFALMGTAAPAQTYRGSVPIARPSLHLVEMAPDVKIYPGETVIVGTTGNANVNQHNYEKRRCKYLGLKCWYEQRSDTQVRPAKDFEVEVALVEGDGTSIVRQTITSGNAVSLALPLQGRRFDQGVSLRAFIKTYDSQRINRASCASRPDYCSSGDLNLIIERSDIAKRFAEIERQFSQFGANAVPADRIRSRDYLDTLLLNTDVRKLNAQALIARYVEAWVSQADTGAQTSIINLVEFALKLSDDHMNLTKLNRARMDALAKQGNYEELEQSAVNEVNRLNVQCADKCSVSDARHLAAALRSLATAQAEKQARINTSDITLAVATLNRGIDVLETALEGQELVGLTDHLRVLADLYQDASNMLSVMRTKAEVNKAIGFMEQSVCLHRLGLQTPTAGATFTHNLCPTG